MSDLQLREFVEAIWNKAAELPVEVPDVCVYHDGVDFLLEVRGKCFAVEMRFAPCVFGMTPAYLFINPEVLV